MLLYLNINCETSQIFKQELLPLIRLLIWHKCGLSMGQVFRRALLWDKQLREVGRQQFNDLDADDQAKFDSALRDVRDIKQGNPKYLTTKTRKKEFKRGPMSFLDVESLIDSYENPDDELKKTYPIIYPVLTNDIIVQYM